MFRLSPVAAAAVAFHLLPASAQAQEAPEAGAVTQMKEVKVQADTASPYQTRKADSPKYTAPLLDTPQTVTVVPAQLMQEQGLLSLREVLITVPGITFGAGEGGGGYGDSINLRGFSANTDITIDGVRDSAQYSRSDSFNVQQIEVINGANSVYAGAGSVGGSINEVSKRPLAENFTLISAGLGTDRYARMSVDANQRLAEGLAGRVNLMVHRNDAPGRDYEDFQRWGLAPSLTLGMGTPTRLTLSYFHQHDDNIPQYGVPFYNGKALPGVDDSRYFGYHNIDRQKIDSDLGTAIVEHEFNDLVSLRNLSRLGYTTQHSIVDPPQGIYCLENGLKPVAISASAPSGYSACTSSDPAPGYYRPSGPRGNTRDTENVLIMNQTDLTWTFRTGPLAHTLLSGFAITHETFHLDTGNVLRNAGGATPNPTLPDMLIADPDSTWTGPVNFIRSATQDGGLDNAAIYLFDTLKLGSQVDFNAGARYERNKGSYGTVSYNPDGSVLASSPSKTYYSDELLLSYRAGIVYKPRSDASLYLVYGNAQTPSKTAVNGSLSDATADVDPEQARLIEAGGKWDVLAQRLSLTAAVFRNERSNYKVASGDPLVTTQQLDGQAHVDGAIFGIAGELSERWAVFANYTYLNSKVDRGVSRFLAAKGYDYTKGDALTNTPRHSASLWTSYSLPHRVQLGYGFSYQGDFFLTQHTGTGYDSTQPDLSGVRSTFALIKMPSYLIHRAMVSYGATQKLNLRLNANNLFDKDYFIRARNNGWATPGDARNFVLTADYNF